MNTLKLLPYTILATVSVFWGFIEDRWMSITGTPVRCDAGDEDTVLVKALKRQKFIDEIEIMLSESHGSHD
jgi:hypothetical protein